MAGRVSKVRGRCEAGAVVRGGGQVVAEDKVRFELPG